MPARGSAAPGTGQVVPDTLVSRLVAHASERPDDVAVTFLDNGEQVESTVTYGELHAAAASLAGALRDRAEPGDRVALGFPSGPGFIRAFMACQYAGMIPVPVVTPRPRGGDLERLERILHNSGATLMLATGQTRARLFGTPTGNFRPECSWLTLEELAGAGPRSPVIPGPGDIAFLQYTSGSTADPRGVIVTHGNLTANFEAVRLAMGIDDESLILSWLPLHHDMGLIGNLMQALYQGVRLVLMSPAHFIQRPIRWLAAITRHRATHSGGPNFAYDLCVQRITEAERAGLDLSGWLAAFNGAEPIRARTLDEFARVFAPCGFSSRSFFSCYGLAEATLYVSGVRRQSGVRIASLDAEGLGRGLAVPSSGESAARLVSCGTPASGSAVRIVDPQDGTALPDGAVGEIRVTGPAVARGYWRLEEATAATFHARLSGDESRFLRTGDLGFVLDGHLYVTGRLKDMLILRGRNLYPHDIELTVASCRDVLLPGGGASFVDEEDGAEHLVIVQEIRNKVQLQLPALIGDIAEAVLEAHEIQPHRIVLIGAGMLPKTSSGKVRRCATRDALRAGQLPIVAEMRHGRVSVIAETGELRDSARST